MKKILILFMALILLLGSMPRVLGEEITFTGTITGGSLHLRKEPSSSAAVVNTYKSGTKVEILENDGIWCKVRIGKKTGYMMAQYLTITANYPHLGWGKTRDDGTVLNVRVEPAAGSAIVEKCMSGAVFELVEESGGWYRVRAGSVFGYLEKEKIQPLTGDFALGFSGLKDGGNLSAADLHSALREIGNPKTIAREEGDFTYAITFPSLGVQAADQKMERWAQETLRLFEDDYLANHSGEKASFTVEYQALKIDDRYQSVLLLGEYRVGTLKVSAALAVNLDTETGALLSYDRDLFSDPARALFSLESGAADLMSVPTDGYSGRAELNWLKYAVLGRDGLQVFMPSGLFLPASLGNRRIILPYPQIADVMTLSSPLIAGFIRTIDPSKPMIALTFDDGPSEETGRILAVLSQYNARATFCVIGNKVETYANTIRRAVAQGNEIACHTWNHQKLTTLSAASIRSQITRTNDAVREVTGGYEIKVLRPPYGSVNKNVRTICADLGMVIAHWKVDTEDWSTRSSSKTYRAIMKGAKNGVIILCHDLYSSTASAVEKAIPELVEKGYQLVTVSELLSYHKDGAQPGTVYAYLDPDNIRTE